MSLNGVMRTSVSGMSAQSTRLATVADNIANSDTHGYKRSMAEFTSLSPHSCMAGGYMSGGVETSVRRAIDVQGMLEYTASVTDLAIEGNGFLVSRTATASRF